MKRPMPLNTKPFSRALAIATAQKGAELTKDEIHKIAIQTLPEGFVIRAFWSTPEYLMAKGKRLLHAKKIAKKKRTRDKLSNLISVTVSSIKSQVSLKPSYVIQRLGRYDVGNILRAYRDKSEYGVTLDPKNPHHYFNGNKLYWFDGERKRTTNAVDLRKRIALIVKRMKAADT